MEKELNKNLTKTEKEGDSKGNLAKLREGIDSYMKAMEELVAEIDEVKIKKDSLFELFDPELPKSVKKEREAKNQEVVNITPKKP